jgi:hypothetical protein
MLDFVLFTQALQELVVEALEELLLEIKPSLR